MLRKTLIAALLAALVSAAAMAATTGSHTVNLTLSAIATVRLTPTGPLSLTIAEPATAGAVPTDATDATTYLQYTVVSGTAYRITVAATGTIPVGTVLSVTAASPSGASGSNVGTSAGAVALTSGMSATNVLTNIQNCYTGTGATSGANLAYSFGVGGTFGDEVPGGGSVLVTYTMTTP